MNEWELPTIFPDLSSAKMIAIDIETRDDDLESKGPGVRREGYIIGVSIGTDDGYHQYFPIAHDEGPNLNRRSVMSWLKKELGRDRQPKVGANLLYDLDYLAENKVTVAGDLLDVQVAEPLIDENATGGYNLDSLATKYLNKKKETSNLEKLAIERKYRGKVQKHLWRFSAHEVGPYAETDVVLPLQIFHEQKKLLEKDDLVDLFKMETQLIPLLLQMRRTGVPIDEKKLKQVIRKTEAELKVLKKNLNDLAGGEVQYWASESIGGVFDKSGVAYPLTPKTKKPSFTKEWLRAQTDPVSQMILRCRTRDKFLTTFLRGSINDQMIDGRIHCLFNQLRGDEYGTVTGRFSSSHPNLQFIPVRDDLLGPLCRSMFIPEEDCDWGKYDYSQIEFRILAHFAMGPRSEEVRRKYITDPEADYHEWCLSIIEQSTGMKVSRRFAKLMNFGLIYGMGPTTTARNLGTSIEETHRLLTTYHQALPFVKTTLDAASLRAQRYRMVKTVLKRRRRFRLFEPVDNSLKELLGTSTDPEILLKRVNDMINRPENTYRSGIRVSGTHKALNAVIQGSAADLLKKAMVDAYEAGIFDVLPIHLTVHDELDVSIPRTRTADEAARELTNIMENAIKFKVPVKVDYSRIKNWGEEK